MEKQSASSTHNEVDLDPPFNFDLEKMRAAVESPTISFPPGLTGEQRREFIRERLAEIEGG